MIQQAIKEAQKSNTLMAKSNASASVRIKIIKQIIRDMKVKK